MNRREFITVLGGTAALPAFAPGAALAQQPALPVIGLLSPDGVDLPVFRKGLGETGFIEGKNVAFEYRWDEGRSERLPSLAKDLADRHVSVIVAFGGATALVAKAATQTIPIVFQGGFDPVAGGLVASLNRPGGNVTGIVTLTTALGPKRLEMLREVLPAGATVVLLVSPSPTSADQTKEIAAAARLMGLRLMTLNTSSAIDIDDAFAVIAQQDVGGILTTAGGLFFDQPDKLVALAVRKSVPAIFLTRAFAEAGGLMSYGPDFPDTLRLAGVYAGRILKGEKPADLPVQQATKIELVINMKTAKALGLSFPLSILGRADEVIE
jgi:putative ABC transport system substrate-binding protein